MGRDGISICRDCGVYQVNGYGSYSTWLDCYTNLAEFDAAVAKEPHLGEFEKNRNARAFLVMHEGHIIEWTSGDCWYHDDDAKVLDGLTRVEPGRLGCATPKCNGNGNPKGCTAHHCFSRHKPEPETPPQGGTR